jgi:hypothetical protein
LHALLLKQTGFKTLRQNFALAKKKIDGLKNGAEKWSKNKIK